MRERNQTVQVEKRKQGGKMVKLKGFINFSIKNETKRVGQATITF